MTLLMAITIMVVYVGMVRVASHRAQSAADFSALVAARFAIEGEERACSMAASLAAENAALLEECHIEGLIAEVRVAVELDLPGSTRIIVRAHARAGPANPTDLTPFTGTESHPHSGIRRTEVRHTLVPSSTTPHHTPSCVLTIDLSRRYASPAGGRAPMIPLRVFYATPSAATPMVRHLAVVAWPPGTSLPRPAVAAPRISHIPGM